MTCPAGTTPCPTPRNNSSLYWIVCQEKNAPGFKVPFIHGTGLPVQERVAQTRCGCESAAFDVRDLLVTQTHT
jgi:hypothetical protein